MKVSTAWLISLLLASCPALAQPTAFIEGLADRKSYESWFASLSGDFKTGALYWVGQRSLAHPGACYGPSEEWTKGCFAASSRLSQPDSRRKTEPDYRKGWNSYELPTPIVVQSPPSPSIAAIPAQPAPTHAAPDWKACQYMTSGVARLDCYDKLAESASAPKVETPPQAANLPPNPKEGSLSPPTTPAATQNQPPSGSCKEDWKSCTDNDDLVNNYGDWITVQFKCKESAKEAARYGTPDFPWFSFGYFLKGTDYPRTGLVTAIERNAQYSNAFGAMVHTRVVCKFDLSQKKVIDVSLLEK